MSHKTIQSTALDTEDSKNNVYVKRSSNIRSLVTRGLSVLTEQEVQNTFTVEAQGLSIGKAVTVIEILKRRLLGAGLTFWQYNQLDSIHVGVSDTTRMINKNYFFDLKAKSDKDVIIENIKTKIIPVLRIKLSRVQLELTDGWK
ncbi:hypothetical protein PORY_001522 [Pneumocystis oryctolagi]|uniref:Uncharacterized protein n=1 Tax=Pneumocystis oryctolagi TaxID=42067 RepID=A0ACB7CFR6_9ASCO|nr:hypothetical protein PORY_001522 [Pneumocystis oryctolagi]